MASLPVPPSQNTFALLDAADTSPAIAADTVDDDAAGTVNDYVAHTDGTPRTDDTASTVDDNVSHTDGTPCAAGDSQVDDNAVGPVDDDVDHTDTEGDVHTDTDGTPQEDDASLPLLDLDMFSDPIVDTLTAHDRVLTTTIAGIADVRSIWLSRGLPQLSTKTKTTTMPPVQIRWRR